MPKITSLSKLPAGHETEGEAETETASEGRDEDEDAHDGRVLLVQGVAF